MYTIINNTENEITIKNSKFIGVLYKISNEEDINKYINEIKNIYKDATHYCYGYKYGDYKKFSDDGEPGGTAGSPIMQVIEKNNLNYVLLIVIRYFGGIKLGAGGLVRAYTKCATEVIKKSSLKELIKGYNLIIKFPYTLVNEIDYITSNCTINNKEFNEQIVYNINADIKTLEKLKLINNLDIEIKKEIFI